MVQVEKLSAVGTFVGGVAHEINNPLMGISNYVSCVRKHTEHERARDMLDRALDEVERIGRIVKNLLLFARAEPRRIGSADPASVVNEAAELTAAEFRKDRVALVLDLPAGLPRVHSTMAMVLRKSDG